jgi:3-oxoadipate enol-lactonase
MPKVKVGDINMYYEVHGKGEPFVMICGGGGSTGDFARLIPIYSPEYKVVLFDNRGSGQTDAPDIPYTMEMIADDLAGLLHAIGIDSAHIYGTSFGSVVAMYLALRHSEKVRSLILTSTACGGQHMIMPAAEVLKTLTAIPKMPPEEGATETLRLFITQRFANDNPAIMQRIKEHMMARPASIHGYIRQQWAAQASMAAGVYERLPEIKAPTLVINGELDQVTPAENAKILASRIPNTEFVILKKTGHLLLEAGDELNRIILDFLRRHRTKKA